MRAGQGGSVVSEHCHSTCCNTQQTTTSTGCKGGRQHGRDHTKGCSQSQTSDCSYGPVANGACEWQQVKGRMHWSEGGYWPTMKGVWAKWVGGGQWTGRGWGVGNAVAKWGRGEVELT